jgi:hypothetical protein
MSSPAIAATPPPAAKLVIPPIWHKLPMILVGLGGIAGLIGAFTPSLTKQFGYSYLLAFMFFLSLCIGAMLLTIIHHLFDANWSVPVRRITEHVAFLLPVMAALFIPIALNAMFASPENKIYAWMTQDPHTDHALHAKQPIFTKGGFFAIAILLFAVWTWLSYNLRKWSLAQDTARDDAARVLCTRKLRVHAAYGIYATALTLTLAAIMWMKALEYQWFSTMYGVYFFAESVWTMLGTLYVLTVVLKKAGPLHAVVHANTLHSLGVLWLAFTVFYAYVHFAQYFLIWNANIPEETFYYVRREAGSWWQICMLIVFGHFLVPFLLLLRIDFKLKLSVMLPLAAWAWLMHFCDISFNVMPSLHRDGFVVHPLDLTCLAFIGGVLAIVFIKYFKSNNPYPVNDPRLGESLGIHHQ